MSDMASLVFRKRNLEEKKLNFCKICFNQDINLKFDMKIRYLIEISVPGINRGLLFMISNFLEIRNLLSLYNFMISSQFNKHSYNVRLTDSVLFSGGSYLPRDSVIQDT